MMLCLLLLLPQQLAMLPVATWQQHRSIMPCSLAMCTVFLSSPFTKFYEKFKVQKGVERGPVVIVIVHTLPMKLESASTVPNYKVWKVQKTCNFCLPIHLQYIEQIWLWNDLVSTQQSSQPLFFFEGGILFCCGCFESEIVREGEIERRRVCNKAKQFYTLGLELKPHSQRCWFLCVQVMNRILLES